MLRPLYQLLEEFPSLREKTLEKIRQIERAQEEARREEAFPLRPIFPPPLRVIYPEPTEPVFREEVQVGPSPMSESESSASDNMSVDSFQEAMDFSSRQDQVSDQAEVASRTLSRRSSGSSQSSSDVEVVEPSVAIPPPIDAIPLSATTGAEFAQRFPSGAPSSAQADVNPGDDDAESDVDVS